MQVQFAYPIIVTPRLRECRDFYARWFGFQVVFEASWFVYLASAGDTSCALALMAPDHPSQPPGPESFNGKGMFVTLRVGDARAEDERLAATRLPIVYALTDEPWGQRRFGVLAPSGTWVDVVQQIEPASGYWQRYQPVAAATT